MGDQEWSDWDDSFCLNTALCNNTATCPGDCARVRFRRPNFETETEICLQCVNSKTFFNFMADLRLG